MDAGAAPFNAILNTRGRRTMRTHSVTLRAVMYDGKLYFSRHEPDSDWFKNALANPNVSVSLNGVIYDGSARLVRDQTLNEEISRLKYPGQDKANDRRISIEVTLRE